MSTCFARVVLVARTCSDTALETTCVASGTSPATAAIVKLTEPWQWTIALSVEACDSPSTAATAAGMVVAGHPVERVEVGREVEGAAPVLGPDVVSVVEQDLGQGPPRGLAVEHLGAQAGSGREQDGAPGGLPGAAQVVEVQLEAVAGRVGHHAPAHPPALHRLPCAPGRNARAAVVGKARAAVGHGAPGVGAPQPPHEEDLEPQHRSAEGGQLPQEAECADAQDAGRDDLLGPSLALRTWPASTRANRVVTSCQES